MGNWVYGCDVCQDVCPWQRLANPQWESIFAPIDLDRAAPPLPTLLTLGEKGFAEKFRGSAIFRIKHERLLRNACIAAGNSGLPHLAEYLEPLLEDASPLIRGHAVWAMGKLESGRSELKVLLKSEHEGWVQDEIRQALN
jgi:epoxyqueuosine reductase